MQPTRCIHLNIVGHVPLGSSQGGITDIRVAIEFASFPPGSWRSGRKEEDYMREREREQRFGSFESWFFVLWEVGVVILRSVNMTLILTSKRNIRNIRNNRVLFNLLGAL